MKPLLEARRAMRLAITEIESACWSLERYGLQMDPETTARRGVMAAQTALQSIDWSALHEIYIQHRANHSHATDHPA